LSKIKVTLNTVSCIEAVNSAQKHLDAVLAILKATPSQKTTTFNVRKRVAPNSNSQQQVRFHSTKKKRRTQKEGISKPSDDQLTKCLIELKHTQIRVCGLCLKENDTQSSQIQQWVQCDNCDIWYHQSCVKTDLNDSFCCKYCVPSRV